LIKEGAYVMPPSDPSIGFCSISDY